MTGYQLYDLFIVFTLSNLCGSLSQFVGRFHTTTRSVEKEQAYSSYAHAFGCQTPEYTRVLNVRDKTMYCTCVYRRIYTYAE